MAQLRHLGLAAGGDLIQSVLAKDHQGVGDPQLVQSGGDFVYIIGVEHAQHHAGGVGRVGQRTQHIKNGANAQFPAYRRHVFHGAVVLLGEHEADVLLPQGTLHRLFAGVDVDAQRLQTVGSAAPRGGGPVAVLSNAHPGGCGNNAGGGGDVEAAGFVAAGAYNVQNVTVAVQGQRLGAHGLGGPGDFFVRFALDGQGGEEGGDQRRAGLTGHNFVYAFFHLVVG